jgi:hypothetical protein
MGQDTIIDPITTRIECGIKFRNDSLPNNIIIIYNSDIKNELKGNMVFLIVFDTVVFDTVNSLKVIDIESTWLRLTDIYTENIIFNQSKIKDTIITNDLFSFYESQLIPIIKEYKWWVTYYNTNYYTTQYFWHFPFRVIPVNENKE